MRQEEGGFVKPMIVLPPGVMSQSDIKKLEGNELCVVVAKEPGKVRFMDPIACQSSRTEMEWAAIKLSRLLLNKSMWNNPDARWGADDFTREFVAYLIAGTPLHRNGTLEEQNKEAFDLAKYDELQRLAREEAREERKKAREEAAKKVPDKTA